MSGFQLERFVEAQRPVYAAALAELKRSRKESHWMWFVFPQMAGLGRSAMAQRYGIVSLEEAKAYLAHPLLGARLRECCEAVLGQSSGAEALFGTVDAMKFKSSMTLFARAAPCEQLFARCLERFGGECRRRLVFGVHVFPHLNCGIPEHVAEHGDDRDRQSVDHVAVALVTRRVTGKRSCSGSRERTSPWKLPPTGGARDSSASSAASHCG